MPKMAQIITAIQTNNWSYIYKLTDRFMSESKTLRALVNNKKDRYDREAEGYKGKKGKCKGGGKGKKGKKSNDDEEMHDEA